MEQHELILLSPYQFPGQYAMTLADEDMACWLNAYSVLWHPAVLWQAKEPPRAEAQYDHEEPRPRCIYALPEQPPLYLPDDWQEKVREAGSIAFTITPDREETLANLQEAIARANESEPSLKLGWPDGMQMTEDELGPFFGIGMGYLLQATLAEAMEHDNLLEGGAFWDDIQLAVARRAGFDYTPTTEPADQNPELAPGGYPAGGYDNYGNEYGEDYHQDRQEGTYEDSAANDLDAGYPPQDPYADPGAEAAENYSDMHAVEGTSRAEPASHEAAADPAEQLTDADPIFHLRRAGEKLLSAREVLYPVTIHLLDLHIIDEKHLGEAWPLGLRLGNPLNVLSSASLLEKLKNAHPEKFAELREHVASEQVEVVGGLYHEVEDPLLPLESQLWNLRKGLATSRELLGRDIQTFGRKRFGYSPLLPLLLSTNGLTRALFLTYDENSGLPSYTGCTIAWSSPDGKQVDAFVRTPHPVDSPNTFFNLGHYWYKTTREDHTATIALLHNHHHKPDSVWYQDLMHLAKLAPVLGQWATFSQYFNEVMAGEYTPSLGPDEFHYDYLSERTEQGLTDPVSGMSRRLHLRRRIDSCITLAALYRSLAGKNDTLNVLDDLHRLEDRIEIDCPRELPELDALQHKIGAALAERLQVRAAENQPGYMVLNPCCFTRRLALEIDGARGPIPIEGPVKACQVDDNLLRLVVEVPPCGFAWIPREVPGTRPASSKLRLADPASLTLRNEFFEVEIDRESGGLRGIRDHKTMLNRIAQRLVFNPGSGMVARDIKVTSAGPALGEIVAEGSLLGEQNQVLANFRQRFRVWLSRPVLDIRIEFDPVQPPAGYPWHAYYGARFAWRDERGVLLRSSTGTGYVTSHLRPQTPDYLELRLARQGTVIFPGGAPFHVRQEGGRMLDIILIPEHEKETTFDITIALDREQPMQTALGISTPPIVVPTEKGPPHIGASGWLFHLDDPNLVMTRLYPGKVEKPLEVEEAGASDLTHAVSARLLECGGESGMAEFRCVRDPARALVLDAQGGFLLEAGVNGDAVSLEVTPNDLTQVQVEF